MDIRSDPRTSWARSPPPVCAYAVTRPQKASSPTQSRTACTHWRVAKYADVYASSYSGRPGQSLFIPPARLKLPSVLQPPWPRATSMLPPA